MKSKRWIIAVAAVVILGGAGFLVWQQFFKGSAGQETSITTDGPTSEAIAKTIDKANEAAAKNDYTTAYALIDDAIEETTDKPEKANLINSKANLAVAQKDLDKALQLSLDAYAASPTDVTAQKVADKYANLGNKAKAVEYYRLAISLIQDDESINTARYYETKIADVESQE